MRPSSDYARYRETVGRSFAGWYGEGRDSWTGTTTNDQVTDLVLRSAPAPDGDRRRRVLDIGCGRGRQSVLFADRLDADVTGLDLLDVWDAPAPGRGSAVLHRGDFLAFDGADLDLLVDNGCLHHQRRADWPEWVRHGRQMLRPGGVWVVSCFLSPTGEVMSRPLPDGRINWWITEEALVDLYATVGLAPIDRLEIDRDYQTRDGYRLSYLAVAFGGV
jgi:SAM-dependent methyltransferase